MPIKLPTACLNYCTLAVGLTLTSSENPLLCRNLTNSSVIIKQVIYYNRILLVPYQKLGIFVYPMITFY